MSAPLLMICASFLFATMGVCVKFASDTYGPGEIVMYRGLVGVIGIALVARARGISLKTRVPAMHAWRSVVGVSALTMWFYAIGHMPLATAVTLNYMSSVWMALFLIGGAVVLGAQRVDARLWRRCSSASSAWRWCCSRRWIATSCCPAWWAWPRACCRRSPICR
jgi:drug/metabolite transporter (DMT)-like permease